MSCCLLLRPHRSMFALATNFAGDVSQWNVGKVTTMQRVSAAREERGIA